tara:strand:- start:1122 stop:2240 length:1119 start_codon:yes stop_codon:yes gene_type:complete
MKNFSSSSTEDLSFFIKKEKFRKIFVLCGKKSYKASGAQNVINPILKKKNSKIYFKSFPYPVISELKKIISSIRKFSPDLIIAVGGGSVIDYAKIANVLENHSNLDYQIINTTYQIKKKFCKLLAIPTTAGSGAEVTSSSVIYINKIKYSVESDKLKPDFFFLIPEFVKSASAKIKSSTGFDAIAQAIESLISKQSNDKSVNFAKRSLEISLKYYLDFLKNPNNENTSAMCLAANLAGEAINISKTTAPHAVSYPFTSIYNISHGHAVSLTLNKFLKFNYENLKNSNCSFNLKSRYQTIFNLAGCGNINHLDQYLLEIKRKAKLEGNFKKLGINIKKDYRKIISGINKKRLINNPVKLEKKDINIILFKNSL